MGTAVTRNLGKKLSRSLRGLATRSQHGAVIKSKHGTRRTTQELRSQPGAAVVLLRRALGTVVPNQVAKEVNGKRAQFRTTKECDYQGCQQLRRLSSGECSLV